MTINLGTREHLTLNDLSALARDRAGFLIDLARAAESAVANADDMTPEEARQIVDALGVAVEALDAVT